MGLNRSTALILSFVFAKKKEKRAKFASPATDQIPFTPHNTHLEVRVSRRQINTNQTNSIAIAFLEAKHIFFKGKDQAFESNLKDGEFGMLTRGSDASFLTESLSHHQLINRAEHSAKEPPPKKESGSSDCIVL